MEKVKVRRTQATHQSMIYIPEKIKIQNNNQQNKKTHFESCNGVLYNLTQILLLS